GLSGPGKPIIAPFFADVDTRSPGGGNPMAYGTGTVNSQPAFGATWAGVGYYNASSSSHPASQTNSFQAILIDEGNPTGSPLGDDFVIEFNYDQITWETGDASGGANGLGGTSAYVGYSGGTAASTNQFAGSGVPGSFLDSGTTPLIAGSTGG